MSMSGCAPTSAAVLAYNPPGSASMPGAETLSHYELVEKLGEGGMGVVYLARDTLLDRKVAVKLLRNDALGSEERRQRFLREARAASALNHPYIVTVHDVGRDPHGTRDFIV